jgi:hypothetical protein
MLPALTASCGAGAQFSLRLHLTRRAPPYGAFEGLGPGHLSEADVMPHPKPAGRKHQPDAFVSLNARQAATGDMAGGKKRNSDDCFLTCPHVSSPNFFASTPLRWPQSIFLQPRTPVGHSPDPLVSGPNERFRPNHARVPKPHHLGP